MSILSPDTMQFQSLVKKLSDGALSQALQMHADPSDPKAFGLPKKLWAALLHAKMLRRGMLTNQRLPSS